MQILNKITVHSVSGGADAVDINIDMPNAAYFCAEIRDGSNEVVEDIRLIRSKNTKLFNQVFAEAIDNASPQNNYVLCAFKQDYKPICIGEDDCAKLVEQLKQLNQDL